ncbi:MAG TPA: dodecin family protein [Solirubrobacteraceae bacterium]|jgi:hypothetical protein
MAEHVTDGVIKVIDIIGVSSESFSAAVRNAVAEASKTIRGITGVDVIQSSAKVSDGAITEYHVHVKIAFALER